MFNKNITDVAKEIVAQYIHKGDCAIDATMGNGYDTLFLAEKVGVEGKVYSFDIQTEAIESTRLKLEEKNLKSQVELILDSHSLLNDYVKVPVKVCMFNLGYLPNGDKSIITRQETTLNAIGQALNLLKSEGLLSIISYYGHPTGQEEKEGVEGYLQKLDSKLFQVVSYRQINRKNAPPILYVVYKK
jgi:predicted methyltransferase